MNKSKGLHGSKGGYRKVTITLTPEIESFLDSIRQEIRQKKGYSLGRTEIIRAALDYLRSLNMDLRDIKDEGELLKRIKKASKCK